LRPGQLHGAAHLPLAGRRGGRHRLLAGDDREGPAEPARSGVRGGRPARVGTAGAGRRRLLERHPAVGRGPSEGLRAAVGVGGARRGAGGADAGELRPAQPPPDAPARLQPSVGGKARGCPPEEPVASPATYHRMLSGPGRRVDIWATEYLQVLSGPDPVLEWVRGTALRPVLDVL